MPARCRSKQAVVKKVVKLVTLVGQCCLPLAGCKVADLHLDDNAASEAGEEKSLWVVSAAMRRRRHGKAGWLAYGLWLGDVVAQVNT